MAENGGQRCSTRLFQTISSEERMQIVERELAQMRQNKDATSCSVQKENRLVDKHRIQHSVRISSEHEIKKEDKGVVIIKQAKKHIG
jgi:hypothetical protein